MHGRQVASYTRGVNPLVLTSLPRLCAALLSEPVDFLPNPAPGRVLTPQEAGVEVSPLTLSALYRDPVEPRVAGLQVWPVAPWAAQLPGLSRPVRRSTEYAAWTLAPTPLGRGSLETLVAQLRGCLLVAPSADSLDLDPLGPSSSETITVDPRACVLHFRVGEDHFAQGLISLRWAQRDWVLSWTRDGGLLWPDQPRGGLFILIPDWYPPA